jgi:DNA-binding transcriptional LysR family regulator
MEMHGDLDWALAAELPARRARGLAVGGGAGESGISQPTLGRHVRALQERLGQPLLVAHARRARR